MDLHPSAFGRVLALVALGLVALATLLRPDVAEPRAGAQFAGAAHRAVIVPPVPIRRATLPTTALADEPAEVVLKVKPLATPASPTAALPPLAPPPYPLLIPVVGIEPGDLVDTFGDPRDSTRVHRAIDILAPTGTPVIAVADGHIIRKHTSGLGGLTVYQVGPDSAWVFYYAHLDRYADGLRAGQAVAQGDTIGYVGETGNAPIPHLHFAVWKARPGSQRLWGGRAINPYTLLAR
jgi:murein DD-endopeptidase MepM/ murein hydrolase activator NlpD